MGVALYCSRAFTQKGLSYGRVVVDGLLHEMTCLTEWLL